MAISRRRYGRWFIVALTLMAGRLPPAVAGSPTVALGPINLQGLEWLNRSDAPAMHPGEVNPHLRMTSVSAPTAADQAMADDLVQTLKRAIAPYADVAVAEAAGYLPLPPDPSGWRIVHYVNVWRSWQETWEINPQEPGTLLYERQPDGALRLIGAMFTAPADATEAELNARVPLSVGRWHLHTNICMPDPIWDRTQWEIEDNGRPRFGPDSAIATEAACEAVGGDFWPTVFGWMVHAYVFADDPQDIWNPMYGSP
jgi:hypothetical protein